MFVDLSFPSIERNGNKIDQLDENKKKDIENVLNDEFCSLDIESQAQSNTCSIQTFEFRVKRGLVLVHTYIILLCHPL